MPSTSAKSEEGPFQLTLAAMMDFALSGRPVAEAAAQLAPQLVSRIEEYRRAKPPRRWPDIFGALWEESRRMGLTVVDVMGRALTDWFAGGSHIPAEVGYAHNHASRLQLRHTSLPWSSDMPSETNVMEQIRGHLERMGFVPGATYQGQSTNARSSQVLPVVQAMDRSDSRRLRMEIELTNHPLAVGIAGPVISVYCRQ